MTDTNVIEQIIETQQRNEEKAKLEKERRKIEDADREKKFVDNFMNMLPGNFLDLVLLLSEAGAFVVKYTALSFGDINSSASDKIQVRLLEKYPGLDWKVYGDGQIWWYSGSSCSDRKISDAIIKKFKAADQVEGHDDAVIIEKIRLLIKKENDKHLAIYDEHRKRQDEIGRLRKEKEQKHADAFAETINDNFINMIKELTEAGFNYYPLAVSYGSEEFIKTKFVEVLKLKYPGLNWRMREKAYNDSLVYYAKFRFITWGEMPSGVCNHSKKLDNIMSKYSHNTRYQELGSSCAIL